MCAVQNKPVPQYSPGIRSGHIIITLVDFLILKVYNFSAALTLVMLFAAEWYWQGLESISFTGNVL